MKSMNFIHLLITTIQITSHNKCNSHFVHSNGIFKFFKKVGCDIRMFMLEFYEKNKLSFKQF